VFYCWQLHPYQQYKANPIVAFQWPQWTLILLTPTPISTIQSEPNCFISVATMNTYTVDSYTYINNTKRTQLLHFSGHNEHLYCWHLHPYHQQYKANPIVSFQWPQWTLILLTATPISTIQSEPNCFLFIATAFKRRPINITFTFIIYLVWLSYFFT
jgi:hypothetical protein